MQKSCNNNVWFWGSDRTVLSEISLTVLSGRKRESPRDLNHCIIKLNLICSTEVSLLLSVIREHIEAFVQCWHGLKYSLTRPWCMAAPFRCSHKTCWNAVRVAEATVGQSTVTRKWKQLFVNDCECNSAICTVMEFFLYSSQVWTKSLLCAGDYVEK